MKMFLSLLILVAFLAIALSEEVVASMVSPVVKADVFAQKVETVRTKEEELALLKFEPKTSSYYNKAANSNEKKKYVSKRNLGAVDTASSKGSKYGNSGSSSDSSGGSNKSNKSNKGNKYGDRCAPGGKKFGNPKYCPVIPPPPPPQPPVPAPMASNCNPTCKPVCTPTCNETK